MQNIVVNMYVAYDIYFKIILNQNISTNDIYTLYSIYFNSLIRENVLFIVMYKFIIITSYHLILPFIMILRIHCFTSSNMVNKIHL